jgi:hypothetical protein
MIRNASGLAQRLKSEQVEGRRTSSTCRLCLAVCWRYAVYPGTLVAQGTLFGLLTPVALLLGYRSHVVPSWRSPVPGQTDCMGQLFG